METFRLYCICPRHCLLACKTLVSRTEPHLIYLYVLKEQHGCENTVREHNSNCKFLFDTCSCLLTHSFFFSPLLLFGLFVHQNVSTLTQWKNKQNQNFGSTIYLGNFTFIWQLYHISDNCRFSIQLGSVDM